MTQAEEPTVATMQSQEHRENLNTRKKIWTKFGDGVTGAHLAAVEELRQSPEKYSFTYPTWRVSDPEGETTCRVYIPSGPDPFPVHLKLHRDGWVLGGLQSEAAWCRSICNKSSIVVIDVDYRLAPEHRFPVALYDCWAAVQWARNNPQLHNIDPTSISIVLAQFARDCSPQLNLKLQLMIVPATDMRYVPLAIGNADPLTTKTCAYPSAIFYSSLPWSPLARESWFLNYYIGTDPVVRS
ncbi:hypothetical protein BBP40_002570 [Aspergillus hancockii]|nr:hypothetical protein BBP40_002570 [Aspergillus hancockii]